MTGAESLLCEMFSCGSLDLLLLDNVNYYWSDVLKQANWPNATIDFNEVMRGVVRLGVIEIQTAIDDRITEFEAIELNERELDKDEQEALDILRKLNPKTDICSSHNYLDTHVWFECNGDAYRTYLQEAIDEFKNKTGLYITE